MRFVSFLDANLPEAESRAPDFMTEVEQEDS